MAFGRTEVHDSPASDWWQTWPIDTAYILCFLSSKGAALDGLRCKTSTSLCRLVLTADIRSRNDWTIRELRGRALAIHEK